MKMKTHTMHRKISICTAAVMMLGTLTVGQTDFSATLFRAPIAYAATAISGNASHNFTTQGLSSGSFDISGNLSKEKGTMTYNGQTLTQCLKMESATAISFSTTGNATLKMFDSNSSSTMPNVQNAITIDAGKTLTFLAGSRCNISGSLLGEGTYKISFPYVRGDVSTNTSKFEGTYEVASSNCRFIQAMDLSKATLRMDEGSYAAGFKAGKGDEASYTHKVGTLTGTGTLGTGTWQISRLLVSYKATKTSVTSETVTVNGAVTLKNPVIELKAGSTTALPADAEIQVIRGSGKRTVSGTVTVIPERPKEGWKWNTSRLASDGILTIEEEPDAIQSVKEDGHSGTYDLQGRPVARPERGILIKNGKKILGN